MEESRPEDRRNVTYMPSDTIFQTLLQLENGDWESLMTMIKNLPRGRRAIDLQQPTVEVNPLRAGEELDIVFAIKTDRMSIGKTAFLLTFLVEVSSFGIGNHYCTNLDPYYHSFPFFSG